MIRVTELRQTGYEFPTQWDGWTDGGDSVYIRYRNGYLSVDVNNDQVFGKQVGGAFDGVISLRTMRQYLPPSIQLPNRITESDL